MYGLFVWDYQQDQSAVQQCFSLTKSQLDQLDQPDQSDFSPSEQAVQRWSVQWLLQPVYRNVTNPTKRPFASRVGPWSLRNKEKNKFPLPHMAATPSAPFPTACSSGCRKCILNVLEVFALHMDVVKVDRDVTHCIFLQVFLVICCKRFEKIFYLFQTYVAQVAYFCKCFSCIL
jgi:hypothetical protein